jgi:hypothetical protein
VFVLDDVGVDGRVEAGVLSLSLFWWVIKSASVVGGRMI